MPSLFLSPSTQEFNPYITEGNEEYYMNLLADALEPYLMALGINYGRNDPALTVGGSVDLSNRGNYDLHLALHSNAAPESLSGQLRGPDMYYYSNSAAGSYYANLIADAFKQIYPDYELVDTRIGDNLYELANTKAPAVLVEVAYHDNLEDALWIMDNIDLMAKALAMATATYFGLPFIEPEEVRQCTVVTSGSNLNMRSYPSVSSAIVTKIPNGSLVDIYGQSGDWYSVGYNGYNGFANGAYIMGNCVL